jgi:uncharacterized protein (TIGR02186 family)
VTGASRHLALPLCVALFTLVSTGARAERLVISLSSRHVQITSTYTGAELVVFGVIERDATSASRGDGYDVVVTTRGPLGNVVVRAKQPLGPIWVNRDQAKFTTVPATLSVLSSIPTAEIAAPELRRRFRLGLDNATLPPGSETAALRPSEVIFSDALVRLKQQAGLYVELPKSVSFVTPNVFRATVPVPATAPLGRYDVEVALFAGGVRLARESTGFEVDKAGFEQVVAREARDNSLAYGLTTAAIALLFGWIATVIFRRD